MGGSAPWPEPSDANAGYYLKPSTLRRIFTALRGILQMRGANGLTVQWKAGIPTIIAAPNQIGTPIQLSSNASGLSFYNGKIISGGTNFESANPAVSTMRGTVSSTENCICVNLAEYNSTFGANLINLSDPMQIQIRGTLIATDISTGKPVYEFYALGRDPCT
jgi:hypothetical protein